MKPVISVIIPVFNVEKFLPKCVESILSQTEKNIEIILVDDGSKDSSPAICDAFAEKDSRVKVLHKENGGVSSARNLGLDTAEGKYISFIDSDDWIEKDTYETALKENAEYNAEIVCWKACFEGNFDEMKDFSETGLIDLSERHADELFSCAVWNKMILREMIEKYKIRFHKTGSYGEDNCFNIKCFSASKNILGVPQRFYHYVFRAGSAVRNFTHEKNMNLAGCIQDLEQFVTENNLASENVSRFICEKKLEAKANCITRLNSPEKFRSLFPEINTCINLELIPSSYRKIAALSIEGKFISARLRLFRIKYLTRKHIFAIISGNRLVYMMILEAKSFSKRKTQQNKAAFKKYLEGFKNFTLAETSNSEFTDSEKELMYQSKEEILFLRTIRFLMLSVSRIENRKNNTVCYISGKQKKEIERVYSENNKILNIQDV